MTNTAAQLSALSEHGIVTDLARLLDARHWAQGLSLFSHQAARNLLLGNVRSRFRGRGMEFEEVRRYQAGDDIRTIDWKVSARAQGTYTKLFCEERERPCHILVDQRQALYFGSSVQFKSVLAAELATAIAWAALKGGDRVGGQVIGDYKTSDSRARHSKQAVLRLIHDINAGNHRLANQHHNDIPSDKTNLANSLEECRRITRPGTAIFIISDFHDFDHAAAKSLTNLAKHADLTLLQVSDKLEQKLPNLGNVAISNGRQSAKVNLSSSLTKAYQQDRSDRQNLLISSATKARALYSNIDTSQTARQALSRLFTN
ncbi:MAG: hypothetical protein ACI854_001717 [Arenicella sp.]|jgi:uncharacterized protein (DUF58 family)